ncbi:MAG TPA: RhuM family protein [Patescibacteria group bacterium]|nr:RhuM family protein [Patescibacteria group bacterium]
MPKNTGEIIIYRTKRGELSVQAKLQNDTVWLTQKQMAELFGKDIRTINEHIKNVFQEGELEENSVIRNFRITAADGKQYETNFYNLDVIISVGYRVKSQEGTQFRMWATRVLRDHLVKGFTINKRRLPQTQLHDLEHALELIKQAMHSKELNSSESSGLLEVITHYTDAWLLLQQYDEDKLTIPPQKHKPVYRLTYEDTIPAISQLKSTLMHKKEASDFFGKERDGALQGIIGTLYQTFDKKELYADW